MYQRLLPYAAIALVAAIVLPNLGGPGFWDPDELRVVTSPGHGEFAARIGPALLALVCVALVFGAAHLLAGARAAALATVVVSTTPLFILHARLATSHMPAMVAAATLTLGIAGLGARRPWPALWAAVAMGGAIAGVAAIDSFSVDLGTPRAGFDWARQIEPIVYGAFPWIAIALVAPRFRRARGTGAVLGTAIALWLAASLLSGASPVLALPGIAVAAGVGLARPRGRAPIAAVCALSVAVLIARDLMRFPGKLAAVGTGVSRELPLDSFTASAPAVVAVVFGFAAFAALWRPRWSAALVAAGAAFGLCLAHVWIPRVSLQHSQKHLFEAWRDSRGASTEPIRLWRVPARAAAEYAPSDHRVESSTRELARAFSRPGSFAIVPGRSLCELRRSMHEAGANLFVIDGDWDETSLVASALLPGRRDRSPLSGVIARDPDPDREPIAVLSGGIEILDVDIPAQVDRGDTFEMVLRYRVTARPGRPWKVFVHFDGPSIRFQGDHEPVHKHCPPSQWLPGDVITDRFTVKAGNVAYPRGRYLVWVGFFIGSHGNWTNLEVVSGDRDGTNRAHVGAIQVR